MKTIYSRLILIVLSVTIFGLILTPDMIEIEAKMEKSAQLRKSLEQNYLSSLSIDAYQRQLSTFIAAKHYYDEFYSKKEVSAVVKALRESEFALDVHHLRNDKDEYFSYSRYQLKINGSASKIRSVLNFLFVEKSKSDLFYSIEPHSITVDADFAETRATIIFDLAYNNDI